MHRSTSFAVLGAALFFSGTVALAGDSNNPEFRDLSVDQKPYVDIVPSDDGPLKVKAWLDHSNHTYHVGENVRLSVSPTQDSYITVLDIGSSGRAIVLFPNRVNRNNFVRGGDTLDLPNGRWSIGVHPPAGRDFVKVFASTSRLPIFHGHVTQGDVFGALDANSRANARDLDVVLNTDHKKHWAEAQLVIRIQTNEDGNDDSDNNDNSNGGGDSGDHGHGTGHHQSHPSQSDPDALNILSRLPYHSGFGMSVSVDHDDATYERGENLTLTVRSERACDLKVVDVGSSGAATVVFPNKGQQDSHIGRNVAVRIPGADSNYSFRVNGKEGTDELVAVCRGDHRGFLEQAWDWVANIFQPYVGGRQKFERDLDVVIHEDHGSGNVGTASTTFSIVR